jgi:hypothetical protein
MATAKKELETLSNVSNDGAEAVSFEEPYSVVVTISGTAPLIFHRWSCEDVAEKAAAKKNSKAKKTDNVESYVYRNENGEICLPAEYLRLAICNTAKFKQDPRSPRKSAYDLFKAGVVSLEELCPLNGGLKDWDYIDQRRVQIQRNSITRQRPAFNKGWTAEVHLGVTLPEYIDPDLIQEVVTLAGRVNGVGDMRPTYGRFAVTNFKVSKEGFE